MPPQILAIDVGNTRIKFGRVEFPAKARDLPRCLWAAAIAHDESACRDILQSLLIATDVPPLPGAVAGVHPRGVQMVLDVWPRECWSEPLVLSDATFLPIAMRVEEPARVGIDRVLNAVAVNLVRPAGRPAIIVDSGTATTVDAVSADGGFEGGAILPGVELAARALADYTARLPRLAHSELVEAEYEPIGRNTRTAIRTGITWGQIGAVRELVKRIGDALAADSPVEPVVFLTGGGAPLLAPYFPQARVERHLALQGLAAVAWNRVSAGTAP
jgi:type III pantothenate kinase